MFSAENLLKDSFLLSLCKYTFLLIIITKTPNLIEAQVVHFCLTTSMFDDILYKERYSIERTNAWLDSYRSLLNRFDVTLTSWQAWNYIAFIVILMKKVKKK